MSFSCRFLSRTSRGRKSGPAVIVQTDAENQRLANTILAMITGNLDDAGQPATVLIDPQTADGTGAGLIAPPW
jgi:mRNA-degrading endonuclease toxin of MazEF toxin-antitoxin module